MNAKVTWQGRLTFNGAADTGFHVPLGAEPAQGGDDDGFRPMELVATGLAGCTGMDVISILQKKRADVTGFEVDVQADRADGHPKVFTKALITYEVTGHSIEPQAVLRAIELSVTRYCPAQAMLGQVFPITCQYHIYENLGNGQRQLVNSGEYTSP